jgi:hypothetical protein
MAVEPYLERCVLFSSGPQGAIESVAHLGEPLLERLGKLESEQHYLRYVNNPLRDSDAWVWWAASSLMGAVGVWFLGGWAFVQIAAALSLIAALVIFMVASPIRLRIIPAALASIIFIVLEGAPILFFLTPNERIGAEIEYLILLPIYLLVLFYLFVRTMKFIFDPIIPEGPGLMMDMLSRASGRVAAADMRALPFRNKFARLTCLYDSLNHLLEPRELVAAFRSMRSVMSDDSLLLFDMNHPEIYPEVWGITEPFESSGPDYHLEIATTFRTRERIGKAMVRGWAVVDGKKVEIREQHRQRAYSEREIVSALAEAQLVPVDVIDFDPYGEEIEARTVKLFFVAGPTAPARPF